MHAENPGGHFACPSVGERISTLVFFKNPFNKEVFLLWGQALLVGVGFSCIFSALGMLLGRGSGHVGCHHCGALGREVVDGTLIVYLRVFMLGNVVVGEDEEVHARRVLSYARE